MAVLHDRDTLNEQTHLLLIDTVDEDSPAIQKQSAELATVRADGAREGNIPLVRGRMEGNNMRVGAAVGMQRRVA